MRAFTALARLVTAVVLPPPQHATVTRAVLRLYPTRINECLDPRGSTTLFFGLTDCHHDDFCASSAFFNRVNPGLASLALFFPNFSETCLLKHCLFVYEA